MAWMPRHKRLHAKDAQGSPGNYDRLEALPNSVLAIRWLNRQCRHMPTEIKLQLAERMGDIMVAPRILAFGAIAFVTLVSPSYAGPCSDDIAKMQARIDAKAHAMAAAGPTGRQVGARWLLFRDILGERHEHPKIIGIRRNSVHRFGIG